MPLTSSVLLGSGFPRQLSSFVIFLSLSIFKHTLSTPVLRHQLLLYFCPKFDRNRKQSQGLMAPILIRTKFLAKPPFCWFSRLCSVGPFQTGFHPYISTKKASLTDLKGHHRNASCQLIKFLFQKFPPFNLIYILYIRRAYFFWTSWHHACFLLCCTVSFKFIVSKRALGAHS